MDNLEHLVRVVNMEKQLEAAKDRVSSAPNDEMLDLLAKETPNEHQDFSRLMFYALKHGTAFQLNNYQGQIQELGTACEYLDVTMSNEGKLSLTPKTLNKKYVTYLHSGKNDLMVSTFGREFCCDDPSKLREEVAEFLDSRGEIRVKVFPRFGCVKVSKGQIGNYADSLVRQISHGFGNVISYEIHDNTVVLKKKSEVVSIDLADYNFFNASPGCFTITNQHLRKAGRITSKARDSLFQSADLKSLCENEALLLSHAGISTNYFIGVESCLQRANSNPLASLLRESYERRVEKNTREAIKAVSCLEGLTLHLDEAVCQVSEDDKFYYNAEIRRLRDFPHVIGALGELVGLAVVYKLKKSHPIKPVYGEPGTTKKLSHGNFSLSFGKSGKNVKIKEDGENLCEIDNLTLYKGVPVVFESKTGNRNLREAEAKRKREGVCKAYGAKPIIVGVRISDYSEFTVVDDFNYRLTLAFKDSLVRMAEYIMQGGRI